MIRAPLSVSGRGAGVVFQRIARRRQGPHWVEHGLVAKGLIAAHSTRHVAWVTDRSGTVLEALILVAVQDTDRRSGLTADYRRLQWIHGSSGNG